MKIGDITKESVQLLIKIIKQYTRTCHSIISEFQEGQCSSVSYLAKLDRAKLASIHVIRVSNMLEYILGFGRSADELKYETFEIRQLADCISRAMENILSQFSNITINCTSKLKKSSSTITIDRTRLELIIYNLLYCCISNPLVDLNQSHTIDLTITEKSNDYIFTIKTADISHADIPFQKLIFSDKEDFFDCPFGVNLGTASLLAAKRMADNSNFNIYYKQIKDTHQYRLYVPKQAPLAVTNEPVACVPNTYLLIETFSDIILKTLNEV